MVFSTTGNDFNIITKKNWGYTPISSKCVPDLITSNLSKDFLIRNDDSCIDADRIPECPERQRLDSPVDESLLNEQDFPILEKKLWDALSVVINDFHRQDEAFERVYWEMMYDGPQKWRDNSFQRRADEESIEVLFGVMKPRQELGDWCGTKSQTNACGSLHELPQARMLQKQCDQASIQPFYPEVRNDSAIPSEAQCLCSDSDNAIIIAADAITNRISFSSIEDLPRKHSAFLRMIRAVAESLNLWRCCCESFNVEFDSRPDYKVLNYLTERQVVTFQVDYPFFVDFPILQEVVTRSNNM